jgi:Leucine-rich repeat (LRR) protein
MQSNRGKTFKLSDVARAPVAGEKLNLQDKNIERVDLLPWNTGHIEHLNLQFNKIETLGSLGQFENVTAIDLSNNNVHSTH